MAEDKKKEIDVAVIEVTEEYLKEKLYKIRGKRVLLDADLAEIYGYDTKGFNRQVKNNIEKFDEDFMFELTDEELEDLRYKNCTANTDCRQNAFGQHSRSVFLVFGSKSVYLINNKHFWVPLFPFLAIIFASFFRFMQANVSPTFISIRAFPIICV